MHAILGAVYCYNSEPIVLGQQQVWYLKKWLFFIIRPSLSHLPLWSSLSTADVQSGILLLHCRLLSIMLLWWHCLSTQTLKRLFYGCSSYVSSVNEEKGDPQKQHTLGRALPLQNTSLQRCHCRCLCWGFSWGTVGASAALDTFSGRHGDLCCSDCRVEVWDNEHYPLLLSTTMVRGEMTTDCHFLL